jgi:hypothetical protein
MRPSGICCNNPAACLATGSLQQIQALIHHFGGHASQIAPPTDPMTLYHTLRLGKPIIMAVQSTPFSGHVVVVRGMAWVPTPAGIQPVLFVNDPLSYFSAPIPYQNFIGYWRAAIVVN